MSFREMKRFETMRAEMQPDCYGGKDCDQIRPRWFTYAVGDKDADITEGPLGLDANCFPPGTQVIVMEPVCPKCSEGREPIFEDGRHARYEQRCRCGFDWDTWTRETYG